MIEMKEASGIEACCRTLCERHNWEIDPADVLVLDAANERWAAVVTAVEGEPDRFRIVVHGRVWLMVVPGDTAALAAWLTGALAEQAEAHTLEDAAPWVNYHVE